MGKKMLQYFTFLSKLILTIRSHSTSMSNGIPYPHMEHDCENVFGVWITTKVRHLPSVGCSLPTASEMPIGQVCITL